MSNKIISIFLLTFSFLILLASEISHANSAPWVGKTLNNTVCKGKGQGYGPFDYTRRFYLQKNLNIVEKVHFNSDVENLRKGITGSLIDELDYTLRAWPNHHRALYSIIKYQLKDKINFNNTPAECYLERAIHYAPNDPIPYLLYGMLFHRLKDYDNALKYYKIAEKISPNNSDILYNIGLAYIDNKDIDNAKVYAKKVYDKNHPLKGLKHKIDNFNIK